MYKGAATAPGSTRFGGFRAGVRVVWMIDPQTRTAAVHTAPEALTPLTEAQDLDGGDLLPGFRLPLAALFAALDRRGD
jgi:Uma2 family endonuclease